MENETNAPKSANRSDANDTASLHGMVPDKSPVAMVLLDVINDLEFEGAEKLQRYILPMAKRLAELKHRAKQEKIPVIYVNDNYGKWQSDLNKLIDRCVKEDVRGKKLVELLRPDEDDYIVIKPKHSGFFSTNLEVLLKYLNAQTIILTGIAGDICVLFTANDAYMRDIGLFVPADCCASNEAEENERVLQLMERILKADIRPSTELNLNEIVQNAPQATSPLLSGEPP